jgi:hypothetical protein
LIWATTNTITATTVLLWQKQPHLLWVSSNFEHLAPKSRVRFWNISKWGWNTLSAVTWKRWWRNSAVLRLSDHLLRQNIRLSSALILIGEAMVKQWWSKLKIQTRMVRMVLNAKFCEFLFAAKRCITTTSQLSDLLRQKFWCEVLKKTSVGSYAGFMMMIIMYSDTICKY